MRKQFSGASNFLNMLSIFFAFTLLAVTSAQTDEPISEARVAKNNRRGKGANIFKYCFVSFSAYALI